MSREILLLVDALAHEKNVDKEVVFSALEYALASATKKRFADDADVRVSIDRETGEYESFRRWTLLTDDQALENPGAQMYADDERAEGKDVSAENTFEDPLESVPHWCTSC
jgi:N utilization substance protein A